MMNTEHLTTDLPRERNISQKKLPIVQTASFDTIIAALLGKSEGAQSTFLYRFFEEANGEVLAVAQKYSEAEIRRRARAGTTKSKGSDGAAGIPDAREGDTGVNGL